MKRSQPVVFEKVYQVGDFPELGFRFRAPTVENQMQRTWTMKWTLRLHRSLGLGFPKIRVPFEGPDNKGYGILGVFIGPACFGKLPVHIGNVWDKASFLQGWSCGVRICLGV